MFSIITGTVDRWIRNDGLGLAASVSFFSIFAMAPLFLLVITLSTMFFNADGTEDNIAKMAIDMFPNSDIDSLLESLRTNAAGKTNTGLSITSVFLVIWAASSVFSRLQFSVRRLFEESTDTLLGSIGVNLLAKVKILLLTFIAGIILAFGSTAGSFALPMYKNINLNQTLVIEILFAGALAFGGMILFASSPRKRPPRSAILMSGLVFFAIMIAGRMTVVGYLASSSISQAYGLASSIVVILIWIYFAAIFFGISASFCAELTKRKSSIEVEKPQ